MSSDNPPDLHMLNLVVRDMAASLEFYQRLGIAVPGPGDGAGAHVQLTMPEGFSLELDTAEPARLVEPAARSSARRSIRFAGMSPEYRARLEQGRARNLSSGILEALGRALCLMPPSENT